MKQAIDTNIARCRLFLSVTVVFCVYVDPGKPLLSNWLSLTSGAYHIDPSLRLLMAFHLAYSALVYMSLQRRWELPFGLASQPVWVDGVFAISIASLTQGTTSPSYPFFAFAAMIGGLRAGVRRAMQIAAVSVGLYICILCFQEHAGPEVYVMRLVYLGLTGYVLFSLGQRYLDLQEHTRQLAAAEERLRIARSLHEGCVQTLSSVDVWLESSRRLLQTNSVDRAMDRITDLQEGVRSEFDALRAFARSLAALESTADAAAANRTDGVSPARARSLASVDLMAQILGIVRRSILPLRRPSAGGKQVADADADKEESLFSSDAIARGYDEAEADLSIASSLESGHESQGSPTPRHQRFRLH